MRRFRTMLPNINCDVFSLQDKEIYRFMYKKDDDKKRGQK